MSKQVGSLIRDIAGNPCSSIEVKIDLVGGYGFAAPSKNGLAPSFRTVCDGYGNWSAILDENDNISPAGTLYRVSEYLSLQQGGTRTYLIQVLNALSPGLHQTYDLIVPEFAPVGTVQNYLTKAYADATYATQGTAGSAGPPGPPGIPGGSPLPLIYASEAAMTADISQPAGSFAFCQDTSRIFVSVTAGSWRYLLRGAPEEDTNVYYVPGANIDSTTTAAFVDWLTFTSTLTIPSWAAKCKVHLVANGILAITAALNAYDLRLVLDNVAGHSVRVADQNSTTARFEFSMMEDAWSSLVPGTNKVLKLQANRVSGTGGFRADTSSDFDLRVTFGPQ